MKNKYLFAPLVLLIVLIVSILSANAQEKTKTDIKVIKVNKQLQSDCNDSVKMIIKVVSTDSDFKTDNDQIDSLFHELIIHYDDDNNKKMKIIKIINGDTVITESWNDSLANDIFKEIIIESLDNKVDSLKKYMFFISDSCMKFSYNFDSVLDPLNNLQWITTEGEELIEIEKIIEMEDEDGRINKEIEIIMHHPDSNIIFIGDDGENIRIERNGEIIFINKQENVKDVNSQLEVFENEQGYKVIIVQTRIVLDELTVDEKDGLKKQGLKTSKKEPEFDFIKFYPNPATDVININFKLAEKGTVEVRISNMVGQNVFEEKLKNYEGEYSRSIQMAEYGQGTYILQIIQGKRVISRKIIVE